MSEFIDGRRWPQRAVTPDSPSSEVSTASTPALISTSEDGSLDDFPGFDVYPGYAMHADSVALHFPLTAVPALAALFPEEADRLHAAALDVEQEAEWQQDRARGRQLTVGGA